MVRLIIEDAIDNAMVPSFDLIRRSTMMARRSMSEVNGKLLDLNAFTIEK